MSAGTAAGAVCEAALWRMRDALRHRGPDGEGAFVDRGVGLVHTRLAIRDPEAGRQPLLSRCGRVALVFNGEIDNLEELRRGLAREGAHAPEGPGDAEVLVEAIACWGPEAVQRLAGMFAFFAFDLERRVGWLARDPLGVKPLLYAEREGGGSPELWFASEVRALLEGGVSRRMDRAVVTRWAVCPALSGGHESLYGAVKIVPPGSVLTVRHGSVESERRYARFVPAPEGGGDAP
ncbi:MAG: asparagine synthetase B, partial [Planctomycetota bacterium]